MAQGASDVPAGMVRLRKADWSDASCGFRGQLYPARADGTVDVPGDAESELMESHDYVRWSAEEAPPTDPRDARITELEKHVAELTQQLNTRRQRGP